MTPTSASGTQQDEQRRRDRAAPDAVDAAIDDRQQQQRGRSPDRAAGRNAAAWSAPPRRRSRTARSRRAGTAICGSRRRDPGEGHRHRREGRRRPVGAEEEQQIEAGRSPMLLLPLGDLAEHVLPDALGEEAAAGLPGDGDEPGQHDEQAQTASPGRNAAAEPAAGALAQAQHERRRAPRPWARSAP